MNKAEIRKIFKTKRKLLSEVEKAELSSQIRNQLVDFCPLKDKRVSIFLPITRLTEINTWPIIEDTRATFYLPKVEGDQLKHIRFESKSQILVSEWGIPEPDYGEEVQADIFDVVLIPLLACDVEGNRVGYGKGFYDDFLALCKPNCLFIGLSFFEPIEKINDTRTMDIRLNHCITPNTVHSF
jgi:5-formyltetrahydrofolate cyclo-ligase